MNNPKSPNDSQSDFWFGAAVPVVWFRRVQSGMALLAIWYFASHWADVELWFSAGGILATKQLAEFIDVGDLAATVRWRLSPLYLVDSPLIYRAFLLIGIALAVAVIWFRRSRIVAVMLWLGVVWLANRSLLISGPEELVLAYGLGYLAVARPGGERDWSTSLSSRLIQVHTTLLIAATALTMLSAEIWWNGTGAAAVAAPIGRRIFDLSSLLGIESLYELITHGIVVVGLAGVIALWVQRLRTTATVVLMVWCGVLGILSSQWMYVAGIAVLLMTFFTENTQHREIN